MRLNINVLDNSADCLQAYTPKQSMLLRVALFSVELRTLQYENGLL